MNAYFRINLGVGEVNLKALKLKGLMNRYNLPHQNLHWRLSNDKTEAIIQADFSKSEITLLESVPWAEYLGDYINGKADSKVTDYIKANSLKWEIAHE